MSDISEYEDDDLPEETWSIVKEEPFQSWRSSDWGRGLTCCIRWEESSNQLSRRITARKGDTILFEISTWRDQWGLWIWGNVSAGQLAWEVAQEDGTPSFLAAFINALTWLREDDFGTPELDKSVRL